MEYLLDPNDPDAFRMMPQSGVRQVCLPKKTLHNASWDSLLTSGGRLFFSLCSELTTSEYAKLAEYRYETSDIIEHFYTRDVILPHERYIRDSKFHTSLAERNDGTLIMATHTTDKSPMHPVWMPEAYYASPWEGFPGSTLFSYDPKTKTAINLGIPAPRESIYGAAYDAKNDAYYMLGFMRGHLYRFDCKTRQSEDMGQVTERSTYRLSAGSDGNIYFTTRSGYLRRILVDERKVESLDRLLPNSCEELHLARSYLCAAANGPDGRLYLAGQFHDEISAFDPKTKKFERIGRFMEPEKYIPGIPNNAYIGGMAFDKKGVLWYLVSCLRHDRKEDFKPACALMRYDILNGGRPEFLGLAGTPERAVTTSVGVLIDQNKELLYMVSTNHADEGPDVTAVDLSVFRNHIHDRGEICRDSFIYPGNTDYGTHAANLAHTWSMIDANPSAARFREIIPVRLWNCDPAVAQSESAVKGIVIKDGVCHGVCSGSMNMVFQTDMDGRVLMYCPLEACESGYASWLIGETEQGQAIGMPGITFPSFPGRQYQAVADIECKLNGGRMLVATRDGLLAIVHQDSSVFSLGAACNHGRVHGMVTHPSGKRVYGVAGDRDDLGNVFVYDDETGLRWLGRLVTDGYRYGNAASCCLSCCALDEAGEILAIGAADALGCVYLCKL